MFSRREIQSLFSDLREQWYKHPDWEELNRQAYLGIAKLESGKSIDLLDQRVRDVIGKYQS